MNAKKLLYFPRILTGKEKAILTALFVIALASGVLFFGKLYFRFTTPVPAIGGNYAEGILGEPRIINPVFASRDSERDISRLIYSSLLIYNGEGNIVGDLAENYVISDDGKTYTLALRKNILWHDNTPLTADDVAFTIHTIQNTQYKSPLRPNWQGVNVEVLDPYTIQFTLRSPYVPFIENLTVGIIPKHIWEKITPEQSLLHERSLQPIGSGPYRFSQIKQEKDGTILSYELKRNANYYREGPYIKEITFIFFRNEDDMIAAVRTGKLDVYGPISEKFISHINKNTITAHTLEMPRLFGIFFNEQKSPLLSEKPIKEAIRYAIDRNEIAQNVRSGGAVPFAYPLPSFLKLHEQNVLEGAHDIEKAKRLLLEAGWHDSNDDGILDKTSQRTKTKPRERTDLIFTITTSDWPDLVRSAQTLKEELQKAGIGITIETLPFTELETKVIRPRNFQILLFGQVYGYEPDPFPFWHSSQIKDPGLNIALYINKKTDRILESARQINDTLVRQNKYKEFEDEILDDIPAIFLYSQTFLYLQPRDLKGAHLKKISLPADRFNEINLWHRETKRVFR